MHAALFCVVASPAAAPQPWEAVGAPLATACVPVELLHLTASDVWAGLLLLQQEQLDDGGRRRGRTVLLQPRLAHWHSQGLALRG